MAISRRQFASALRVLGSAPGRVGKFLQAHHSAQGKVVTMTYLAEQVGYKGYEGVNLQYGMLAQKIAEVLNVPLPPIRLTLLADFVERDTQSNAQWQIVMKPEFAAALEDVGWV